MQLASLLQQQDFDFETTRVLTKAFDEVWSLMAEAGGPLIADYQAPATRLLLAQYLVDRAMQGERDVERMIDGALDHIAGSLSGLRGR